MLVRQRPGSAKGVMFITIEDETGVANLVVWEKVTLFDIIAISFDVPCPDCGGPNGQHIWQTEGIFAKCPENNS